MAHYGGLPSLSDCLVLDLTLRLGADRPVAQCARPEPLFTRLSDYLKIIKNHLRCVSIQGTAG